MFCYSIRSLDIHSMNYSYSSTHQIIIHFTLSSRIYIIHSFASKPSYLFPPHYPQSDPFPTDLFSSEYECTVLLFLSRLLLYDLDLMDEVFLVFLISVDLFFTWFLCYYFSYY